MKNVILFICLFIFIVIILSDEPVHHHKSANINQFPDIPKMINKCSQTSNYDNVQVEVKEEEEQSSVTSEQTKTEDEFDLSDMKVSELRNIAKMRGFTRYSKMNRTTLLKLLQ